MEICWRNGHSLGGGSGRKDTGTSSMYAQSLPSSCTTECRVPYLSFHDMQNTHDPHVRRDVEHLGARGALYVLPLCEVRSASA